MVGRSPFRQIQTEKRKVLGQAVVAEIGRSSLILAHTYIIKPFAQVGGCRSML